MYDIFIAGISSKSDKWRETFKELINSGTTVLFASLNNQDIAERLYHIDNCKLAIFYLGNSSVRSTIRTELGDAIGREKSVIVCMNGNVTGKKAIQEYCKQRGVLIAEDINNLAYVAQEYLKEIEMFENMEETELVPNA